MKTEFKGTKGEWKFKEGQNMCSIYVKEHSLFIDCWGNGIAETTDQEMIANAKLISCAPEMIEMISLLIERLEENDLAELHAVKRAKELIKKATTI